MDLTFLLRSGKLFSDLDERELAMVQQIAARKEFRKGDILFHEGDPSRGFYIVVSGSVKIYRVSPDGRERVLHVVEAGDLRREKRIQATDLPRPKAQLQNHGHAGEMVDEDARRAQ
jgi:CRP/FNR family transcriptional regulator